MMQMEAERLSEIEDVSETVVQRDSRVRLEAAVIE